MKQVYQSEDGKIFSTVAECIAHEDQNINTLYYYRYTPSAFKSAPVCYSVKAPRLYDNLCDALFREFIRNMAGPEIVRSFSFSSVASNYTYAAYIIEKITAKEYQNALTQRELNLNSGTGSLEFNKNSTPWIDKLFFAPSNNALIADNMMSSDHKWYSLCSAPIKALTTDDLKGLNINYIPPFTTDSLKSLNNKSTSVFKKTISITDLLY